MEGIILLGILVALFIYAANRYNKSQEKIKQHVQEGNITREAAGLPGPVIGDEVIYVNLKRRHFEDTNYSDNYNCAVAKALKEMFPDSTPFVMSHCVQFPKGKRTLEYGLETEDTSTYQWQSGYTPQHYENDANFALHSMNIGHDSIIRKVKLSAQIEF